MSKAPPWSLKVWFRDLQPSRSSLAAFYGVTHSVLDVDLAIPSWKSGPWMDDLSDLTAEELLAELWLRDGRYRKVVSEGPARRAAAAEVRVSEISLDFAPESGGTGTLSAWLRDMEADDVVDVMSELFSTVRGFYGIVTLGFDGLERFVRHVNQAEAKYGPGVFPMTPASGLPGIGWRSFFGSGTVAMIGPERLEALSPGHAWSDRHGVWVVAGADHPADWRPGATHH